MHSFIKLLMEEKIVSAQFAVDGPIDVAKIKADLKKYKGVSIGDVELVTDKKHGDQYLVIKGSGQGTEWQKLTKYVNKTHGLWFDKFTANID